LNEPINKQTLVTFEYSDELGCLIWTVPFLGVCIWSITKNKLAWTIFSILMIFFIVYQVYITYLESKRFNLWIEQNDQTIIFFYPTNRQTQEMISKKIGNRIDSHIKQMCYNKSKIEGDFQNKNFVKMGLGQLNRLYPNHPRLVQINKNSLVELINLYELNRVEKLEINRIDQIVNEINTYA